VLQQGDETLEVSEKINRWFEDDDTMKRFRHEVEVDRVCGLADVLEVLAYLSSRVDRDARVTVITGRGSTLVRANWSERV